METITLRVASVRELATDIFEYRLEAPDGAPLPPFTPGAHLHVTVPSGGTRQYSLSNDPEDRSAYVIAIKREADGKGGSKSFIERTGAGDSVEVSLPRNDFELEPGQGGTVLIAGGIGITPILSMARVLRRQGAPFSFYYLSRSPELTAYREELETGDLAEALTLHHDFGDPGQSLDLSTILAEHGDRAVYCCGPTGLLHAVRSAASHWPRGSVRFEDFGTSPAPAAEAGEAADGDGFFVRFEGEDERFLVPGDKSILQVLQEAGRDMPSSCEAGTCGTCRMKLVEGEADHRDLVLFDDEFDDNIIICCSRAKSQEIVIADPD